MMMNFNKNIFTDDELSSFETFRLKISFKAALFLTKMGYICNLLLCPLLQDPCSEPDLTDYNSTARDCVGFVGNQNLTKRGEETTIFCTRLLTRFKSYKFRNLFVLAWALLQSDLLSLKNIGRIIFVVILYFIILFQDLPKTEAIRRPAFSAASTIEE